MGTAENLYGHEEIAGYRAARNPASLARIVGKTVVTTYGWDCATTNIEFTELGISTSELVRETLQQRIKERQSGRRDTVYAATRDLCGVAEAPDPGLSARRMSVLLRERHARKRSR